MCEDHVDVGGGYIWYASDVWYVYGACDACVCCFMCACVARGRGARARVTTVASSRREGRGVMSAPGPSMTTPHASSSSSPPPYVDLVLKSAQIETRADVRVRFDARETVRALKAHIETVYGDVEETRGERGSACRDRTRRRVVVDSASQVLIYSGKVLKDDDVLGEVLARAEASARAYDADNASSPTVGTETMKMEYVLHLMVRTRRVASMNGLNLLDDEGERETREVGRDDETAGLEREPVAPVPVRRDSASMSEGHTTTSAFEAVRSPRDGGMATPTARRVFAPSTPSMPEFEGDVRHDFSSRGAVTLAASPHLNAMYHAAYHAAYASLSPNNAFAAPGPPPMSAHTLGGQFLNVQTPPHVAQFGTPGSWTQTDHRANAQNLAQAQNAHANHPDLPAGLNIPPGARVRVIHIRIDLKLIFKLSMMVFFLSQDASTAKFIMYILAAILVYLQQTGALAVIARWLTGNDAVGRGGEAGANNGGANRNNFGDMNGIRNGDGNDEFFNNRGYVPPARATHAWGHREMPQSLFGEVKILLYSFLASIFPSWLPPRLHEARRAHQD